ncbi:type VI secretion system baseplate subunit TssE [Pseudomonas agarici]|uniref:type VI secretion system baseplate subunit TssE n=1 Tax=Pseudomonas agarici TaxID=46677 RepID=UPI0015A33812|nr:type VI secretion system baseplate subunit TssE [Pseudomonas agarici]NWB89943.1 type VI secretion system baseplate subunit TssE [Pseudomonas agarici]
MAATGILAPLFERLAGGEDQAQALEAFDHQALANSVRSELLRLFNTRRAGAAMTSPPSILDYGIADWTSLQSQRSDDRRKLAREIRQAVEHFEPRLALDEVDVRAVTGQPQQLSIVLHGALRSGDRHWPVAFVIEQTQQGLEVSHERFD